MSIYEMTHLGILLGITLLIVSQSFSMQSVKAGAKKVGGIVGIGSTTPIDTSSADALGLDPKDQRLPLLERLFVVRRSSYVTDKDKEHLDFVSGNIAKHEPTATTELKA